MRFILSAPDMAHRRVVLWISLLAAGIAILPTSAAAQPDAKNRLPVPQEACDLLDDANIRGRMDGRLRALLVACGRQHELGGVRQDVADPGVPADGPAGTDSQVNDSSAETGTAQTQNETAIAVNAVTGTLCAGFNDSYHGVVEGAGFTGFSRSTDAGASWTDGGALGSNSSGDPSIVWRAADGYFYFAALETNGLGIWRSTDDCQSFSFLGNSHVSAGDDKELMAVDNHPLSPYYGRLYVAWIDFFASSRIYVNYSDDGTTWSTPLAVSAPGAQVQGAWPTVGPDGELYVGWLRWNPYPSGPIDIEIVLSTNGGDSFTAVTNPMTGQVNPRDASATGACGRPALNGSIRYLPSPQLAVGPDGALHVVYSYDPDGFDTGDVANVYYRRSLDQGATWQPEVQLNDDATPTDQFFPTLSVGETQVVSAAWYDRRLDANNLLIDYYQRFSFNNGATWEASTRRSDVSTPIYLDPNIATCYHGDYDQQLQTGSTVHLVWADDRQIQSGHNQADVWSETLPAGQDFLLLADPIFLEVCADDAIYNIDVLQFESFSEPVTLGSSGEPVGATVTFAPNPVTPPGSAMLTVSNLAAASEGAYGIQVFGESTPSDLVRSTRVYLGLFITPPDEAALLEPANGEVDQPLRPTFSWTPSATATEYELEIATDSAFTNIVHAVTLVSSTHQIAVPLAQVTTYYWRVRSTNVCGSTETSSPFSLTTREVPLFLLVDDDDNLPDVRATYEAALNALNIDFDLWDTANSDDEPLLVDLASYHTVIWFTGDEFGGSAGPGSASETALGTWLDSGKKCLILSGQDYKYDRGLTSFMQNYLGALNVMSDTLQTEVTGAGTASSGLGPYTLSYPYTNYSDTVTAAVDAEVSFVGDKGDAALHKATSAYHTHFLGFPWEAIATENERIEVLDRLLTDCEQITSLFADGFESGDLSTWTVPVP